MGRLVIAHHKSYHPYKAENIERVRKDEEEARLQEAKEEGRLKLADAEARIDVLRKRAGISEGKSRSSKTKPEDDIIPEAVRASLKERSVQNASQSLMKDGHINLFADIAEHEHALKQSINRSKGHGDKKESEGDTDKGFRLAPTEAERNPWYTKEPSEGIPKLDDEKRNRDKSAKQRYDPMREVEASLSKAKAATGPSKPKYSLPPPSLPVTSNPELNSRLSREQSERARAAELIARKRRERIGNDTPTTISGEGYGNQYNKRDVDEAQRRRRDDGSRWKDRVRNWDGTQSSGNRW